MGEGAIAIVGASCRFPGGDGLDAFWRLVSAGREAISEIDAARWPTRFYYHPNQGEPGKSYTWAAGLIDGVDLFDPAFFGISPREAAEMDPQQRILLELAWHALEDAGIPAAQLSGSLAGVYIGASARDYADLRIGDPASGGPHFMTGNALGVLANRISHVFDLRGPSLAIDTACSSSLVALHHACEALRAGQVPAAIVGGVNLLLAPYPFLGFCRAGMLSRRGRTFAFDARADGYVRGEGGAVVVLKRFADALRHGDPIRALIHGTGVNSDGRTIGLALPSEEAQAGLLRELYERAGVAADDLAFFEMHGTGTPAGDPVEAAAVGRALGRNRREALPIGSVKTNIGHLEPASGMAGLLKAALALEHGVLPPTLNCERPSPNIDFAALNLRLVRQGEPIALPAERRYAGVNSFGFGGTNAHAILAAPPPRRQGAAAAGMPPLVLSAHSQASLKELARRWHEALGGLDEARAATAARTAARGRDQQPHRLVALADDGAGVRRALGDFLDGVAAPGLVAGTALCEGKLAFVFSGNGAQFPGMAGDAWRGNAAFRAAVEEADAALSPELGWSVGERLAQGVDREDLERADIAQPLLFAIEVGIVRALAGLGLTAEGHLGHSVGEIAAAWAAGALPLAEAARIVLVRSRAQQRTRGKGRMAALALAEAEARALFAEIDSRLEIAAVNAARSLTVAGGAEEIARLGREARRRGIAFRRLDLDFAFHSGAMEGVREEILAGLEGLNPAVPRARLVSSVTGEAVTAGLLDGEHWWRNIRRPVRFAEGLARLIEDGCRIFLEIGPNGILQSYLNDGLRRAGVDGRVLASLSRRRRQGDPFPEIAARCHVAGGDFGAAPVFDGPIDPRGLPLYPWQRARCWFERTREAALLANPPFEHPLLGCRGGGAAPLWLNHLDARLLPWLAEHRVDGVPVLPASAFIEIALAAARCRFPEALALEVADLELRRPLPFDGEGLRELLTTLDADSGEWRVSSRPRLSEEPATLHAAARLCAAADLRAPLDWPEGEAQRRLDAATLYALAREVGLDYGPSFRTVERVEFRGPDEAVAYLEMPAAGGGLEACLLHPALADGALQSLLALLGERREAAEGAAFLPWRFGRVRLLAPFGRRPRVARLRLKHRGIRSVGADLVLDDEAGERVAEFADCRFRRVELTRPGMEAARMLRLDLVPALLDEPAKGVRGIAEIPRRLAASLAADPARAEQRLLFEAAVDEACPVPPGGPLPEFPAIWRTLLAEAPEFAGDLALVAGAAVQLPPDAAAVEQLTRASPASAAGIDYLCGTLERIALLWPKDRQLRVLELGAGEAATRRLTERLAQSGTAFTYRASDPESPALSEARFDIVVAVNVLARLRLDRVVLARLRERMASGGLFLAVEPEPNPLWHLLFGGSPLRSGEEWSSLLAAAGFLSAGTAPVAEAPWRCAALWAGAPPLAPVRATTAVRPIVLVGGGRFAATLGGRLAQAGHRVSLARHGDAEIDEKASLVFLAQAPGRADMAASTARQIAEFAGLAKRAAAARAPLWLVTCDAQQASLAQGNAGLLGAALLGMARTLRNELPRLELRLVDVAARASLAERARRVAAELSAASGESEIVYRAQGRRAPRLRRGLPPRWARACEAIALSSTAPPGIDRLSWREKAPPAPGPGEIEIEVGAAGLNFRDLMWAAGLLPEEAVIDGFAGPALGLECAGTVAALGPGVGRLRVGDRVMALAPAAIASRVVTQAAAAAPIPFGTSLAAAATVPVAFLTAFYALGTLARLSPRECVLIHAAAGGVGLAAIQYAKDRGATVVATAGSAAKRAFLSLAGADHVLDSRDAAFADAVREVTGGEGVDVVLNSLAGAAMEASLGLLKPFGRFLELGKRDLYDGRRIPLRPLRHNAQYFAIDIDQLPRRRPELARALLREASAALFAGRIRPLAHRIFPFAELADALRLMQASRHIGKIVLVPDGNRGVRLGPSSAFAARAEGTYLVTGGIDGFGFAAARWLAARGARSIALLGRRGEETPGAAARVAELAAAGADIRLVAADVCSRVSLAAALAQTRAMGPPLVGVVHAAAEIADGLAADLDPARVEAVLRPKLTGALLLDALTREDPIEMFLLYSSATTFVGAPGQGAYVAANLALEALARRRRAAGRPATAVAWGPIADSGRL
ncbi:MAG TPA: SDR family NAD(P)-dependent oxidoreductase, partial [Stellaceae bacterium]|nr:SDR family NAD(P)-dependent oxidoreductase [Stellaceae bacterium]